MHDLSPGKSLPAPMVVEVTDVDWDAGKSRRAEVDLIDAAGNELRLIDYNGANLSVRWKPYHRYRISKCNVHRGGHGFDVELAPSKRTIVEPLGPTAESTQILIIGDTHIGRTKHPRTGETIDPLGAFITATQYAIDRDVDAVVHVGDIFHDNATLAKAELARLKAFEPLAEANIPFYYVRGNHGSPPGNELLDKLDGSIVVNLDEGGSGVGEDVRVFGINHHPEGELPWDDLSFPHAIAESTSILSLHQTIEQLTGPGPDSVDLDRLSRLYGGEFDLIVSGHHHDAIRRTWGGVPVMYSGAAERMSTNQNPTDRVVWLVTVANGSLSYERNDLPE